FRLISATNEDLEARVGAGSFREDLYYRINTIPIRIAALRARGHDVALLARHFLGELRAKYGGGPSRLSEAALARLSAHPWRGNVRELQHAIEMLVVFFEGGEGGAEELPPALV